MERDDLLLLSPNLGKNEAFIKWKFPREGRVELNTEGAAKGNP